MGRVEGERAVERGRPVVEGLARGAVDEVDVQPGDPGVAGGVERAGDPGGVVGAAEGGEHVGAQRLHADGAPVHAGPLVGAQLGAVDGVGVALDGDLGVAAPGDGVEDAHEGGGVEQGGRAATEEHAGRFDELAPPHAALDVGHARRDVVVDEPGPVGPRREVAVVAARRAERDVHVDTEG